MLEQISNIKKYFAVAAAVVVMPGCAVHRTQVMSHEDAQQAIKEAREAEQAAMERREAQHQELLKQREGHHNASQELKAIEALINSNDPALRAAGAAIMVKRVPSTAETARDVAEIIKLDDGTVGCQVQSVSVAPNGTREILCAPAAKGPK